MKTPEGLTWGWRAVHPDFQSSHGFRWPFPGQWAEAEGPYRKGGPCPSVRGDGLCIAKTWQGAASGSIPTYTALIVGYSSDDVLGEDAHKVRVRRAFVLDVIDVQRLIREGGFSGADLGGANLYGANLSGANLYRANLSEADLSRANLSGADLYRADLREADLSRADLSEANLRGANLYRADLSRANLYGANLSGADLRRADLSEANLRGANLSEADLSRANLYRADLRGADLRGANGVSADDRARAEA